MNKKTLILALSAISFNSFASELYYPTIPTFKSTEHGELLVGMDGLALYTFKKDTISPFPPKCTKIEDAGPLGSCLARWPAATITLNEIKELAEKDLNFNVVLNTDINKLQLTYMGLPVYYWFKDSDDKNFTGDGVSNAWSLIIKGQKPTMFDGLSAKK